MARFYLLILLITRDATARVVTEVAEETTGYGAQNVIQNLARFILSFWGKGREIWKCFIEMYWMGGRVIQRLQDL